MTDRELLKQALYLIDAWERGAYAEEYPTEIEALRQALAQPEQEPVAYKYTHKTNPLVFYFTERKGKDVTQNPDVIETALYTAPPKREWVGLTDDERLSLIAFEPHPLMNRTSIVHAVEAKLKEKNGGV
jgi:hypothetical protein